MICKDELGELGKSFFSLEKILFSKLMLPIPSFTGESTSQGRQELNILSRGGSLQQIPQLSAAGEKKKEAQWDPRSPTCLHVLPIRAACCPLPNGPLPGCGLLTSRCLPFHILPSPSPLVLSSTSRSSTSLGPLLIYMQHRETSDCQLIPFSMASVHF